MQTMTDDEIIAKHDPKCRNRARMELQIVDAILKSASKLGYAMTIQELDDGDYTPDLQSIKTNLFNLDDATLWFEHPNNKGNVRGIRLVFGNSGWDAISDYHSSLANDILKDALELADKLMRGN